MVLRRTPQRPGLVILKKGKVRITISTESLTAAEVDQLRSILLYKFGIESTRNVKNQEKGQYRIRIQKREVPKVQSLVSPHMPPSMCYPSTCSQGSPVPRSLSSVFGDNSCSTLLRVLLVNRVNPLAIGSPILQRVR